MLQAAWGGVGGGETVHDDLTLKEMQYAVQFCNFHRADSLFLHKAIPRMLCERVKLGVISSCSCSECTIGNVSNAEGFLSDV